jgi:UPF0755 protein
MASEGNTERQIRPAAGVTRRLLVVLLVLSALAAAVLWREWQVLTTEPLALDVPYTLEVSRGDSLGGVATRLEREGIIDDARAVRIWARLSGRGQRIQAGEYRLTPGMTLPEMVRRMEEGRVFLHNLTVVEGWTFRQFREALASHPEIRVTLGDLDDEALMEALGHPDRHPEGWFLPETYRFARGTTDRDVLVRAMQAMEETLESLWQQRDGGLPFDTPYEALILASIVERETGHHGERGKVAGVFTRRLHIGMRLQTDPTVIYGLPEGEYQDRLRHRHLRTDTPYNTYTRHGLPPTPIALPGRASLEAAVWPEPTDYLYFVSRKDGTHHFSRTLEEHNRAVRYYQLGQGEPPNG